MLIPFEPSTETQEQLHARIMLGQLLKKAVAAKDPSTLAASVALVIGRAIFDDADYFKGEGNTVVINEDQTALTITVYLDRGPAPKDGIWFRHFIIEFCDAHGFHLSELMPPFKVEDLTDEDALTVESPVARRAHLHNHRLN